MAILWIQANLKQTSKHFCKITKIWMHKQTMSINSVSICILKMYTM